MKLPLGEIIKFCFTNNFVIFLHSQLLLTKHNNCLSTQLLFQLLWSWSCCCSSSLRKLALFVLTKRFVLFYKAWMECKVKASNCKCCVDTVCCIKKENICSKENLFWCLSNVLKQIYNKCRRKRETKPEFPLLITLSLLYLRVYCTH